MFIHLFGFSMHQIFNLTQLILILLKTTNAELPEREKEPELCELVKTYQIHSYSRKYWKYNENDVVFRTDVFLLIKQLIAKLLQTGKTLMRKVKFQFSVFITRWWFWVISEDEARDLFCIQLFQRWIESLASKYGHLNSNFLKNVFHKFYPVHSWIICPIYMCS